MIGSINIPCEFVHRHSCTVAAIEKMMICAPTFLKSYGLIHLIPLLLFKLKSLKNRPVETISKALKGYSKSILFILGFCFIGTRGFCNTNLKNPFLGSN